MDSVYVDSLHMDSVYMDCSTAGILVPRHLVSQETRNYLVSWLPFVK